MSADDARTGMIDALPIDDDAREAMLDIYVLRQGW